MQKIDAHPELSKNKDALITLFKEVKGELHDLVGDKMWGFWKKKVHGGFGPHPKAGDWDGERWTIFKKLVDQFSTKVPKMKIGKVMKKHPKKNYEQLAELLTNKLAELVLNDHQTALYHTLRKDFPLMPEMRLKKIIINHPKKSLEEIKKIAEEKKAKFIERAQKWGQKFMGDSSRSPSWFKKDKSVERPPWKSGDWDGERWTIFKKLVDQFSTKVPKMKIGKVMKNHPKKNYEQLAELLTKKIS
jgi:hypothetical protein